MSRRPRLAVRAVRTVDLRLLLRLHLSRLSRLQCLQLGLLLRIPLLGELSDIRRHHRVVLELLLLLMLLLQQVLMLELSVVLLLLLLWMTGVWKAWVRRLG